MGTQRDVDTAKVKTLCGMISIANLTMNKPWIPIFDCNIFRKMCMGHSRKYGKI
jgi:hypothetical protein